MESFTATGGGMVRGTGTGLVNNARDTVGLIWDGAGYLLNKATRGYTHRDEAARTEGRVEGALALGQAAMADPLGTAKQFGEKFLQQIKDGAAEVRAGQVYDGTG